MPKIKVTIGESMIETELEPLQIMEILREFLFYEKIEVTHNIDQPISINYPAVDTADEPPEEELRSYYGADEVEKTPKLNLGTRDIMCLIDCPECRMKDERWITIGKLFNCRTCNIPLWHEPHVQGMYKAVQRYEFKEKK